MTYFRETLIVKREARPRPNGRWLIAYSSDKDDPVRFPGHASGHKPYALLFGTRYERRLTNHAYQLKSL